jgi:hypothetical protein
MNSTRRTGLEGQDGRRARLKAARRVPSRTRGMTAGHGGKECAPTRNVYKEQGSATGVVPVKRDQHHRGKRDHKGRMMKTSMHVIANAVLIAHCDHVSECR